MKSMLAPAVKKALVVWDRTYIPHPAVTPTLDEMIFPHADIHCEKTPCLPNALYSALHVLDWTVSMHIIIHNSAISKEATPVEREVS